MTSVEEFWDEFAAEYVENQEQSRVPIEKDVTAFLVARGMLPQKKIFDLAGGSGRFLPFLHPYCEEYVLLDISKKMLQYAAKRKEASDSHVTLLHQSQEAYVALPESKPADLLLSVMNPTLDPTNLGQLLALEAKTNDLVVLLRVVEEEDDLLTLVERACGATQQVEEQTWMSSYQTVLEKAKRRVHTQDFTYSWTEEVPLQLVEDVYRSALKQPAIQALVRQHQINPELLQMNCRLTWRLLWWHKEETR